MTPPPVRFLLALLLGLLAGCSAPPPAAPTLAERLCTWQDHDWNPLIEPPPGEDLLGDPAVLTPAEAPDDAWHIYANSLAGIHHYRSDDGLSWQRIETSVVTGSAMRAFLLVDDGRYHLFFERFADFGNSEIRVQSSDDLVTWDAERTVLVPELAWEQTPQATVGNPFVTWEEDAAEYRLYYSASGATLPDTGFPEPLHIGMARADSLDGPWFKEPEPILSPSDDDPWRNHGAGSIKLLDERMDGLRIALNNGIYVDADGRTGSAVRVLSSEDGLAWSPVCEEPILAPTGEGTGWKSAFVYGFDPVPFEDQLRVYYNARDGWVPGTERIGMSWRVEPE